MSDLYDSGWSHSVQATTHIWDKQTELEVVLMHSSMLLKIILTYLFSYSVIIFNVYTDTAQDLSI